MTNALLATSLSTISNSGWARKNLFMRPKNVVTFEIHKLVDDRNKTQVTTNMPMVGSVRRPRRLYDQLKHGKKGRERTFVCAWQNRTERDTSSRRWTRTRLICCTGPRQGQRGPCSICHRHSAVLTMWSNSTCWCRRNEEDLVGRRGYYRPSYLWARLSINKGWLSLRQILCQHVPVTVPRPNVNAV